MIKAMNQNKKCARKYGKAGLTPRRLTIVGFLAPLRRKDENFWINIRMDGFDFIPSKLL